MTFTQSFLQKPEVEWKSSWRIDLERRAAEEAVKEKLKRKFMAKENQHTPARTRPQAIPGTQTKRLRVARCANKVLSDTPRNVARRVAVKRLCSECDRPIRQRNKTGKCQVCIYGRERCTCGKTIYQHVANTLNKCMACYHEENRKSCTVCGKLLNASNKYGLCKVHYGQQRHKIHSPDRDNCLDCGKIIRAKTRFGRCRKCARPFNMKVQNDKRREMRRQVIPAALNMLESTLQ